MIPTLHTATPPTRKQRGFRIDRELVPDLKMLTPRGWTPRPSTILARVLSLAAVQPHTIPPALVRKAPLFTGFGDLEYHVPVNAVLNQNEFELFSGAATANLLVCIERGYKAAPRDLGHNLLANQLIWALSRTQKGQRLWESAASDDARWRKFLALSSGAPAHPGRPPKYLSATPV